MPSLVLVPDYLAPTGDDVVRYARAIQPNEEILEQVGFFVPGYLDDPNLDWIAAMSRLEVVQLPTLGFDAAIPHMRPGLRLCNAVGVHEQSTAELTVGAIISRWREIDSAARMMPTGTWHHVRGRSLQYADVLIVGCGGVGSRVAQCLAPLGPQIRLVGRTARQGVHGISELPDLLPRSDVVIVAVPLTVETTGLVDDAFLRTMRAGSLLVNVSRGAVVDTAALVAAATEGHIEAFLDVTDPEPLPADHPLWRLPGVLITPHAGGDTDAFPRLARDLVADQVNRWRSKEPLKYQVEVSSR